MVLGHFDADGLAATAIFVRALCAEGHSVRTRIVGRGENPWSREMRAELERLRLSGLIATDLGVRPGAILPGTPTVVVDHHVPTGEPDGAVVISGHGLQPTPTSSLLAFWCVGAVLDEVAREDLLWLAALGLIGDMADDAGFPEFARARRYGITALRGATSLINQARRASAGDASPALTLLLRADGPKDVLSGRFSETTALLAAKAEVQSELAAARRSAPKVRNGVALIRFHSPCQIHPLLAQQWRTRLKDKIVIAANTGYRPGWVHFAARTASDRDLIGFLAERAPPGADENYGSGHRQATGGALRFSDWNAFVEGLGFGPQEMVLQ